MGNLKNLEVQEEKLGVQEEKPHVVRRKLPALHHLERSISLYLQ